MGDLDLRKQEKEVDEQRDELPGEGDFDDDDSSKERSDDFEKDRGIKHKEDGKEKSKKNKKKISERVHDFFANPKKRLLFIISLGIILIALVGGGVYVMNHEEKTSGTATKETVENTTPVPTFPAVLDGVMTDEISAARHPVAVMVENHPDSRPQAGLDKASVVYEAIAEGGITRFLAVFGTHEAEKVGPVRSARTYYVDWAHGFDAFYAHVGGNMDALQKIPKDKIYDLDQFRYSAPYWRELKKGVALEHTMFTSTPKLRDQAAKNKYPTANNFSAYKYKDDPTGAEYDALPETQTVTVDFSTAPYKVDFVYDKKTNSYKRNMAGKSHVDQITKDQLNPKDIVVMTMTRRPTVTSINEPGYIMDTIGTGKARFYMDGKEILGTWKKETTGSRELFYDSTGAEITFNRGQLWICVISPDSKVTAE